MSKSLNMPQFHPVLGRLEYDEDLNSYSGKLPAHQQKITICIRPDEQGDFAKAEERAIRFARDSLREIESVTRYLAGSLLDMANEDWAEPERAKLSVKQFLQRISLDTITFDGKGGAEFIFADGDIFSGHAVVARMRPDGVLVDGGIEG